MNNRLFNLLVCVLIVFKIKSQSPILQPSVALMFNGDHSDTAISFKEIQDNANAYFENFHQLNGPALAPGEKRYRRWEYFWQNKVTYSNSRLNGDLDMHNFYKKALQSNLINTCTNSIGNPWQLVGPNTMVKSEMGIIHSVAVHPTNSQIMFAGSYVSGLFKTTNGGANWSNVTDYLNLPAMGIKSVQIDRNNPNNMLIATGDGYKTNQSHYAYGIYRSTNGGLGWQPVTLNGQSMFDVNIQVIKYDDSDLSGNTVYALGENKIYKSLNGGQDWQLLYTQSNFPVVLDFVDIEIDIVNPNILYVSTNGKIDGQTAIFYPSQIYVSTNAGISWVNRTPIVPAGYQIGDKISVEVTQADINMVYAAIAGGSVVHFMKSADNGVTWTYISNVGMSLNSIGYGSWNGEFEISNLNSQVFYVAGTTTSKSVNGGLSFSPISAYNGQVGSPPMFVHADIRHLKLYEPIGGQPLTDDVLHLGTDGGVVSSTNGGSTWNNLNGVGLNITQFYGFDDMLTSSIVNGGAQDNNSLHKNLSGVWQDVDQGDGGWTVTDDISPNIVYGFSNQNVIKSTNSGLSYQNSFGSPSGTSYITGNKMYIDPCNQNKIWLGEKNLYYHNGTNWVTKWTNSVSSGKISAIAIAPSNCNIIYVAYTLPASWGENPWTYISKKKFFKSIDGGNSFTDISANNGINLPIYWNYITDIKIDPFDPNHLYVSFSGYEPLNPGSSLGKWRVLETHDGGNNFTDISNGNGLPPFPISTLEFEKGTQGTVYAGTDIGIYKYDFPTSTWQCFNNNLPSAPVTNIEINYCTNKIMASTFGRGIWECAANITNQPISIYANVNNVCPGTPVTLTASGGVSYVWSPGGQTGNQITVMPNATTTYDVSAVNLCGGTSNANIVVNVINATPPVISITASPLNACAGDNVTLTATGGVSYVWQGINSTSNQVNVTPQVTTTYYVNAVGTNGCTTTQQFAYTPVPLPVINITGNSDTYCLDNAIPVVLTASGASTYVWTPGNLVGASVSVQPTAQTTYIATGTTGNCSSASSFIVKTTNCNSCFNCSNILPAILFQNLSVQSYCVTQDLTISGTVGINNSSFRMSPNVRIIIPSGSKFTISNSRLSACSDMWQGIEVQDGGSLIINNSIIEDAIVAVDISNHTQSFSNQILSTFNAVFNKNLTSISISNYQQTLSGATFKIEGSVFTCRNLVKPLSQNMATFIASIKAVAVPANPNTPYASDRINENLYPRSVLKAPFAGQLPDMGIYLDKVGVTISPLLNPTFYSFNVGIANSNANSTCFFDYLNNGIISINSNLEVANSIFQNMDGGIGIRTISDGVSNYNQLKVSKNNITNLPNKFIDCGYGIFSENVFVHKINENEFRSSKTKLKSSTGNNAIWASTFVNSNFSVKDNAIYNYKNGVVFSGSVGNLNGLGINTTSLYSDVIAIKNNTIMPNMPSSIWPQSYVSSAITVFNVYNPKYFIFPNVGKTISVETNTITAYRAVNVSGFAKMKFNINDNDINLEKDHTTQPTTEYGILMSECYSSTKGNIYNNFIKGYPSSYLNNQNYAIIMKNCSDMIVSCNETRRTYNGLAFNASNPQVGVFNNIMRNQVIGFLLDNNGVVGATYGAGPNTIGTTGQPADNEWLGGQWNQPGRYKTFTNNSTAQSSPMYVQNSSNFDPSGFGFSNPPLPPTLQYNTSVSSIFTTSGITPVNCGTGIPPALVLINNPVTELEKIVQNQNLVTGNVVKVRRVQKNAVFKELKADQTLTQNSTILQNFYNTELSTNNQVYATIEEQIAQEQLSQASNALAAVSNQDDVDNNHQIYNTCMLHYKDRTQVFTAADSANLVVLCQKCPYTDGFVVFRARALYNLVFKTVEAFVDNCDNNAQNRLAATFTDEEDDMAELLKVELYPNPANNKFTIVTDEAEVTLNVIISDVQGKKLQEATVNVENYEVGLQVNLPNGIYIVSIRNTTNYKTSIKKLVIQK